MTLILLNKPFGVLCQFSADGSGKPTLKDHVAVPQVYPAGRLDTTSEGLVALTDNGQLQAKLAEPAHKLPKTYWVQVEGLVTGDALAKLRTGVSLKDGTTLPASARELSPPELWPRTPPIRTRKNSPTSWVEIILREGKNRQVRRMTAAVGFPTLRLVRTAIGPFMLNGLPPGAWREVDPAEVSRVFQLNEESPSSLRKAGRRAAGRTRRKRSRS